MDSKKIIRALLVFFLGWIGSLIINHTSLKPEGYRSRTGALIGITLVTCGVYQIVVTICNFLFDPAKEKNIGYKKED